MRNFRIPSCCNVEVINGYVGKQKSEDYNVQGAFLRESTANRLHYALTPAINTLNSNTGVSENFIFYDEILFFGGEILFFWWQT